MYFSRFRCESKPCKLAFTDQNLRPFRGPSFLTQYTPFTFTKPFLVPSSPFVLKALTEGGVLSRVEPVEILPVEPISIKSIGHT